MFRFVSHSTLEGLLVATEPTSADLQRKIDTAIEEQSPIAVALLHVRMSQDATPQRRAPAIDRALRNIEAALHIRGLDRLHRLGADLFAIALPDRGLSSASATVKNLLECGAAHDVEISVGVAAFPYTAQKRDELLARAHAALQHARRQGGNRVALARTQLQTSPDAS